MPKNPVTDPVTDQEIGGTRTFSLGREQILMRLWELALLSPEAPSATGDPFKANQHALVKKVNFFHLPSQSINTLKKLIIKFPSSTLQRNLMRSNH